jgi:hypothetical protein
MCEEVVAEYAQARAGLDARGEGHAAAAYLERLGADLRAQQREVQASSAARLSRRLGNFPRLARILQPVARALVR